MFNEPRPDRLMPYMVRIDESYQCIHVEECGHSILGLGFKKFLDRLCRYRPRVWFSGKNGDHAMSIRGCSCRLKSLASKVGKHSPEALLPFLCQVFGHTQYIFVQIDGRTHDLSLRE